MRKGEKLPLKHLQAKDYVPYRSCHIITTRVLNSVQATKLYAGSICAHDPLGNEKCDIIQADREIVPPKYLGPAIDRPRGWPKRTVGCCGTIRMW